MRQHKYRAYNKKLKSMAQVLSLELDSEFGGVEVWGKASVDFETGEHDATRDFWSWDDCEVMEYVGKADKAGKEIYEGDIVKVRGIDRRFRVTWGKFTDTWDFLRGETWMLAHETLYMNKENCEVIGNIYANPELLKEQASSATATTSKTVAQIKQDLLVWAGLHRGNAIKEEAVPRFHEIIDMIESVEEDIENSNASVRQAWQKLDLLMNDIKELCQEELAKEHHD